MSQITRHKEAPRAGKCRPDVRHSMTWGPLLGRICLNPPLAATSNLCVIIIERRLYLSWLTVRKICRIGVTRCQILRPKCTKFNFRYSSAPCRPRWGSLGLQRSSRPDSLAVLKNLLLRGRSGKEGEGEGWKSKGEGRGEEVDGEFAPSTNFGVAPAIIFVLFVERHTRNYTEAR